MIKVVDIDFIKHRLDEINEALGYIKEIVKEDEGEFIKDFKSRFALRHLILIVVESAASIALHILAEDFNKRVSSYSEAFERLSHHGILSPEIALEMISLTRLRNLIVHRYWLINDARIYRDAKSSGITIIERFIKEVKNYIGYS